MNRYRRIDTCMLNVYLFSMGVGVRISFWSVLKLSEWNQSFVGISEFCWNFWGPPNLSSCCNNKYSCVKNVSFKSVIFGRYKMIKKPLRIHTKSLSDALAPSKKKFVCGAGLRQLCKASTFIAGVPIVCQIFATKLVYVCVCACVWYTVTHTPTYTACEVLGCGLRGRLGRESGQTVFCLLTKVFLLKFSKKKQKVTNKINTETPQWVYWFTPCTSVSARFSTLSSWHQVNLFYFGWLTTSCRCFKGKKPPGAVTQWESHQKHIDLINAFINFQSDTTGISHKWGNPVVVFQAEASSIAIWTMVQWQNTQTLHVCYFWW